MRTPLLLVLGLGLAACSSSGSSASVSDASPSPTIAELGSMAPDFTLTDIDGNEVSLSDYRGKTVVLEWFNPQCPYVVYAYEDGPLGSMAARFADQGVVWLAINSGAPGMQGAGMEINKNAHDAWSMKADVLIDETGEVGHMYKAKTTPHMYIVDKDGMLVYQGALDNAPRGDVKGGSYMNYVEAALSQIHDGRTITEDDTKPYGCSVKYAK